MVSAPMQEFSFLPVVDVATDVVRDRAAATAESIAIESHQRIDTHIQVTSQLIEYLIATATMAHDMDATRIMLMGSQPQNHVRGVARSTHVGRLLADPLETISNLSDAPST